MSADDADDADWDDADRCIASCSLSSTLRTLCICVICVICGPITNCLSSLRRSRPRLRIADCGLQIGLTPEAGGRSSRPRVAGGGWRVAGQDSDRADARGWRTFVPSEPRPRGRGHGDGDLSGSSLPESARGGSLGLSGRLVVALLESIDLPDGIRRILHLEIGVEGLVGLPR